MRTDSSPHFPSFDRVALLAALLALILRLAFVLLIDPAPELGGGDAAWYMTNGRALVTTGTTPGPLQTAPLYPILLGVVQVLVPGGPSGDAAYTQAEMQTARAVQAILGAALVLAAYALARRWLGVRAARVLAVVLAISPGLIVEAGNLTTESLFLCLMMVGLAWYAARLDRPDARALVGPGIVLGLAILTRAVFLLFPLVLVIHLALRRRDDWRRLAAALLLSSGAVVATWTVYNALEWQRFVVGGEGLLSFLYQGAEGGGSPEDVDSRLEIAPDDPTGAREAAMRDELADTLTADPLGWAAHRVAELAGAYLQPHNTNYFGGASIKDAAADWLRDDRSLGGLGDVVRIEAFWSKLAIYLFHFAGLALGAAGMILTARRWRALLPLYGVIAYYTAIHLALLALPRYLFPIYPIFWTFAAGALAWAWERQTAVRRGTAA